MPPNAPSQIQLQTPVAVPKYAPLLLESTRLTLKNSRANKESATVKNEFLDAWTVALSKLGSPRRRMTYALVDPVAVHAMKLIAEVKRGVR